LAGRPIAGEDIADIARAGITLAAFPPSLAISAGLSSTTNLAALAGSVPPIRFPPSPPLRPPPNRATTRITAIILKRIIGGNERFAILTKTAPATEPVTGDLMCERF
jgi:hypothetical protein